MLVGGIDVSGDIDGNNKFFVIIVATPEAISSMIKEIGYDDVSLNMRKHSRIRARFSSLLNCENKDILAFCIKTDRDKIFKRFKKMKTKKYISTKKLLRIHNQQLYRKIRDRLENFTSSHNCALSDVNFQCDSDCMYFAKTNALRIIDVHYAYVIADIIAWLNNHGGRPKGVIELDCTDISRQIINHY